MARPARSGVSRTISGALRGPPKSSVTREATTEMANYPKKMKDPTEAALSAIQEALNIRDEDEGPASPAEKSPFHRQVPSTSSRKRAVFARFREDFDREPIGIRGSAPTRRRRMMTGNRSASFAAFQSRPAAHLLFYGRDFLRRLDVGCLPLSWAYFSGSQCSGWAGSFARPP